MIPAFRSGVKNVRSLVVKRQMGAVASMDELKKALEQPKVVTYYTASWCGPCRAIAPVFEKLEAEYESITFAKVDIDQLPDAASDAKIMSVPTFHFYKDQQLLGQFAGADKQKLEDTVDNLDAQ